MTRSARRPDLSALIDAMIEEKKDMFVVCSASDAPAVLFVVLGVYLAGTIVMIFLSSLLSLFDLPLLLSTIQPASIYNNAVKQGSFRVPFGNMEHQGYGQVQRSLHT